MAKNVSTCGYKYKLQFINSLKRSELYLSQYDQLVAERLKALEVELSDSSADPSPLSGKNVSQSHKYA